MPLPQSRRVQRFKVSMISSESGTDPPGNKDRW